MRTLEQINTLSDQEFTELINNKDLHDKLYRYALKLYGNQDDAKDLLQEVLYKLRNNREKFGGGNFQAWAYTVMRNAFINYYRVNKKAHKQHDDSIQKALMEHPDSIADSRAISDVHARSSSLDVTKIMHQFRYITNSQRSCLSLLIEGYSYEEIAVALNAPIGTVKGQIFYGRKRLHELLVKDFGDIMPQRGK